MLPSMSIHAKMVLAQLPTFAFASESGYTLGFREKESHTSGSHGETGVFRTGVVSLPSELFHTFRKPCVAGYQNGKLCRFWVLVGRCSRRTQKAFGTAMRLCASLFRRRRGPAGLRDLFSFLSKLRLVRPALRAFPCVRGEGWYHYPRSVPHVSEITAWPGGRTANFAVF